jgi:alpha-L-fucosidase
MMAGLTTRVQLVSLISLFICGVLVAADDYIYGRATMYYDNNQVMASASCGWQQDQATAVASVGANCSPGTGKNPWETCQCCDNRVRLLLQESDNNQDS